MSTINIRIDEGTKKAASRTLADLGLDLSTGVKIFLHQVITDKALPFRPSKNPAALRVKWDQEVAEARKSGKKYDTAEALFKDLGIE